MASTSCTTPIAGKIALEEHVSTPLFSASFTTPFENHTNEASYGQPAYSADVGARLSETDIAERGVFNTTLAVELAAAVNDQMHHDYKQGNYSHRFEFFCNVALQDPDAAAAELTRCVTELGGKGVMVNGYTNNGSVNNVVYLDHPTNAPFWRALAALGVPLYLHPCMPPPDQQRIYAGYDFLAGSPYGFSVEAGMSALRLMLSGLFDEHPSLRIILGRCGEALPFLLRRTDERMRHFEPSLWQAKENLRYYWQRNFYITAAGILDEGALWTRFG
ncbi:Uu.00g026340.m01.CDS01 [Anthostomella pinea]|uniref:Uu.00g026340.m01.CDS01 n=1 Tax=Anthostomella pinea TaxID=933095 RepID=A0AAI8V8I7_9PEZI|nr:Uu.00g026340.m01.CDS01 [Anthostomella pinea]